MALRDVLGFWFGDWDDSTPLPENSVQMALWWGKSPAIDAGMRDRFETDHFVAARGTGHAVGEGAVATILLLDQVPRNIFRGTPHMFATDGLARQATRRLIGSSLTDLPPIQRYFALMPLMHAEDLESHDLAVREFEALVSDTAGLARAGTYSGALSYELKHRTIIERFGRYPHRNACIGRESSAEELAFLEGPGSSF